MVAEAKADNPYAPPTGHDVTPTSLRSWWKWLIVLSAAFSAGTAFAWVDAARISSEVLRLMLPITIFGCAAAAICFLDHPKYHGRLLLIPVAAVAAFVVTGICWEMIGTPLFFSRSPWVVLLLIASNCAGLILVAGALVWSNQFSWRNGIRFAVVGALLGTLSVLLVNTQTSSVSRPSMVFLCMTCWQFAMLVCVAKLRLQPTVTESDMQEPDPVYVD